jgi:hypothetical protein
VTRTVDIAWLVAAPTSEAVVGGDDELIDVEASSVGLSEDSYEAFLVVDSNDPISDRVILPVHLHVTSCPDGVALEDCRAIESAGLLFGTRYSFDASDIVLPDSLPFSYDSTG